MKSKLIKIVHVILFLLLLILFQIVDFSNSKYSTNLFQIYGAQIAEPIIILESFKEDNKLVNKLDFPLEYEFEIKNYNELKTNEVDFIYNIEIEESNLNFPIKYKIIDLSNNQEIKIENNISEDLKIKKETKEEKKYKLVIEWEDEKEELSQMIDLKLKLNLKQYKIGEA